MDGGGRATRFYEVGADAETSFRDPQGYDAPAARVPDKENELGISTKLDNPRLFRFRSFREHEAAALQHATGATPRPLPGQTKGFGVRRNGDLSGHCKRGPESPREYYTASHRWEIRSV